MVYTLLVYLVLSLSVETRDMRQVSIHKCLSLDFTETMDGVHAIGVLGPQSKRRDKRHETSIYTLMFISRFL